MPDRGGKVTAVSHAARSLMCTLCVTNTIWSVSRKDNMMKTRILSIMLLSGLLLSACAAFGSTAVVQSTGLTASQVPIDSPAAVESPEQSVEFEGMVPVHW